MSAQLEEHLEQPGSTGSRFESDEGQDRALRRWRRLAVGAAASTFALIVLGGVVRITGSGMGCGADWPLCNGKLVPSPDLPTLIEFGHRVAAAAVSLLVLALAAHAWLPGRGATWRGRRRLALWAVGLLAIQVMLGAVAVRWELPPATVVLHLGTAMLFLGLLVAGSCFGRSDRPAPMRGFFEEAGVPSTATAAPDRAAGVAWLTAGLGLLVVLAGALVANLDAARACQGFPLCNGEWWPGDNWRMQLHWGHRMAAYGLAAWALALPSFVRRVRPGDGASFGAARSAAGLAGGQIAVGAAMVLLSLPGWLRALHVALGSALFASLVATAWLVGRREPVRRVTQRAEPGRAVG
ncbi:MAG: heme A synthase [Gemmatimonadota bacterium]